MSTSNSIKSIREEILELATHLAETQTRLNHLAGRLDEKEDNVVWKNRCEELERSYREAVNSAKWLRAQNEDYERRLDMHQPEINNALEAREAAFRRLRHARKVIRDLLDERGDVKSPRSGTISQEEIEQALYGDVSHRDNESSASSDTDRTVRGVSQTSSDKYDTPEKTFVPASSPGRNARLPSVRSPVMDTPSSDGNPIRFSPKPTQPITDSPERWSIHFKKPPGSASICEGPMTLDQVQIYLSLNDNDSQSLRSLGTSAEPSLRLQIMRHESSKQNIAFFHDPIFVDLENGKKSYAIYWGRPDKNQDLERYISRYKADDLVFHTFTYPLKEKAWYYIGAHHWSVVELPDFWPLEGKSRNRLIKKLCEWMHGEVDEKAMGELLDNKEMQQFCIELTRVKDSAKVSTDFAQSYLGRSPKIVENKRTGGVKE